MSHPQTIFIVDDEPDVCAALSMLVRSVGLQAESYASPQAYLTAYDPSRAGCLILDMRMPGMSGLELQKKLCSQGQHPPIIMISGHGEIPNAVQAVQAGAVDFLQKPVSDQLLLDRIYEALQLDTAHREKFKACGILAKRYHTLTPREREVMQGVIAGKLNKTIASEGNVSTRTIEIHRAHVMEKMQAGSLSALLAMSNQLAECQGEVKFGE